MTPHFMTRSGINHGFQHVQELEKQILSRKISSIQDADLAFYNKTIFKNSEKLFAKPISKEFFSDGPFLRNMNQLEQKLVNALAKRNVQRVDYTNHISVLNEFEIISRQAKVLDKVAKFLKENPSAKADDLRLYINSFYNSSDFVKF